MKNLTLASIFALTLPVTLFAAFSANQLKASQISRGPAIEKTYKPLNKAVLKFLIANAK